MKCRFTLSPCERTLMHINIEDRVSIKESNIALLSSYKFILQKPCSASNDTRSQTNLLDLRMAHFINRATLMKAPKQKIEALEKH